MRTTSVLLVVLFAAFVAAFSQTTIHVPAGQPTIQGAINAAQNGDTVAVSPGTYYEHINFNGKAITVTSTDGPATTIIDGSASGVVVTFKTSEGAGSVLSGLTIQNGRGLLYGGGISIDHASPRILDNVIMNNAAIVGNGIYVYFGSPEIRGNTISGNRQQGGSSGDGGAGIELLGGAGVTLVIGNLIENNTALAGASGGGIDCSGCAAEISNNIIRGNAVFNHGGGISIDGTVSLKVTQNIIANNISEGGGLGGGIYLSAGGTVSITNNTLYGNVDSGIWSPDTRASAIYVYSYSAQTITNNVMVAPIGEVTVRCDFGTSATFLNNDVYSPSGQAWAGSCNYLGNGNISVDPAFVNAAGGDFHLLPNSPVIDAGTNSASGVPPKDLDGNNRIYDGNFDGTATVDLGAYEFSGPAVSVVPSPMFFDPVVVTTTSASKVATVYNASGQSAAVIAVSATPPYSAATTCTNVPAHSSCPIGVTFAPTSGGPITGTLTVSTDASASPLSVALSGAGADFTITLPQTSASIPREGFASFPVNVSGMSSFNGTVDLSASAAAGVTVTLSPARVTPAATGSNVTMTVVVSPTAVIGDGTIQVQGTATGTQLTHAASFALTVAAGPQIAFSPATVAFGAQAIGPNGVPIPVTATNTGAAPLNITAIVASPSFLQTNNCPSQLAAAASCTVNVTFQPGTAQAIAGALTFVDDAANSPQAVGLTGTGVFALVSTPASVQFAPTAMGQVSQPVTVTIKNVNTTRVSLAEISVSGGFFKTTGCGVGIDPGASCTVTIHFAPLYTGSINGALTLLDSTTGIPLVVPLSGDAVLPLTFSPASLDFGNQLRGTSSPPVNVTMTNVGNLALSTNRIFPSGLFTQTNNCPQIMAPGASCTLTVLFSPIGTGTVLGSVTIDSNAIAHADASDRRQVGSRSLMPQMLSLAGTGIDPVSFSASSLDFGSQPVGTMSTAKSVMISNSQSGQTQNLVLSVYGNFAITTTCGASLAPYNGCTVSVRFAPTSPGATSGSVIVQSAGGSQIISLYGTGM